MAQEIFATQSGNTYSAELTRRAVFAQYARTASNSPGIISGGLIAAGDLTLTAPASGMSVNVAVGEAIIGGSEGGAQGGYYFRNSAQQNLSISAANATNPRIDTVVVTAGDSLYTEPSDVLAGTNAGVLAVVTGAPTAGATLGNLSGAAAVPLSSLVLGYVLVPANATNIITADIANVAGVAHLGLASSGYEWAYAQITSTVAITALSESSPTPVITLPTFTPDGSPVVVEFFCEYVTTPTFSLGNTVVVGLYEGATEIGRIARTFDVNTSQAVMPTLYGRLRFTPSAAPHSYAVSAWTASTTGTPAIAAGPGGSGNDPPAFARVTKV